MDRYEGVSDEPEDDPEDCVSERQASVELTPRRSRRNLAASFAQPQGRLPIKFKTSNAEGDEDLVQIEDELAQSSEVDVDAYNQEDDVFRAKSGYHQNYDHGRERRKRKVLSPSGEWVYEHELAGRTIVHEIPQAPIRRSDRKQGKRPTTEDSWAHNPFRLVNAKAYGDDAPFEVIIAPQVLITMDFHAHMSVAEVIGLLGGRYEPETRKLLVLSIFPCRSIGTRKECEMDPISEMEAVQQFASLNLVPVGWYHSHPTFEPSPSCRDIETQTLYQNLFTRPTDKAEPFLGFIISPFLKSSRGRSVIECIHLAEGLAQDEKFRLPCRIEYVIEDTGEFFEYPGDLVDLYEKLQLTYMRTLNYAGTFHEGYFINKITLRLAGCSFEPSARALLQRFRNKVRPHLQL